MRRALLFSVSFSLLAVLAWWALTPSPRHLHFAEVHELYGFVDGRATAGLDTVEPVLTLLTQLAPATQRATAKQQVKAKLTAPEIRLGIGFKPMSWAWHDAPATPTEKVVQVIPSLSLQQLSALPNGYLLLRSESPAIVAADPRLRRWLGVAMSDTLSQAKALTIAVGEESTPARAQIGLCLEVAEVDTAVDAIKLIDAPAPSTVLTFKVIPQAEHVAKTHKLVVVRFEVDALYLRLAAQPR
jgi:hypothetical protein